MRPTHVVAAAMLIMDERQRVLMVQTHNRIGRGLILPGGMVEEYETPAVAAEREVAEELGLTVTWDRLLAVDNEPSRGTRPAKVQYIFLANERLSESIPLTLQPEEIASAHWVERAEAPLRHVRRGETCVVLDEALRAVDDGVTRYFP